MRGTAHAIRATRRRTPRPGAALPVIEYNSPAVLITGGHVVRDLALPELAGPYLYGDNSKGDL